MQLLPLRLRPGQDLRGALDAHLAECQAGAAFVLQGIGSLSVAQLRLAGAEQATEVRGDLEILTLAGSLAVDGAHLAPPAPATSGTLHQPMPGGTGIDGGVRQRMEREDDARKGRNKSQ